MQRDFDRWMREAAAPAPAPATSVCVVNNVSAGCARAELMAALATVQARVFGRAEIAMHVLEGPLSLADLGNLEGMRSADLAGAKAKEIDDAP
jgi:hypothetical protein